MGTTMTEWTALPRPIRWLIFGSAGVLLASLISAAAGANALAVGLVIGATAGFAVVGILLWACVRRSVEAGDSVLAAAPGRTYLSLVLVIVASGVVYLAGHADLAYVAASAALGLAMINIALIVGRLLNRTRPTMTLVVGDRR